MWPELPRHGSKILLRLAGPGFHTRNESIPPKASLGMRLNKWTLLNQHCSYFCAETCQRADKDQQASSVLMDSVIVNDLGIVTFASFIAEKLRSFVRLSNPVISSFGMINGHKFDLIGISRLF